ncbi:hypothetical protein OO014_15170 [Intrasporangium calvum]|uniref:Uncharacterized protein n=1 Tax=Intrasporangium calvum TaxID=53358 RepID=A0ABT5GKJ7_9MICO|nr:hypothetical protein [Intrasporangium calvum]MDC5698598.1 hypothetical protein [Intrasporangium calvum]
MSRSPLLSQGLNSGLLTAALLPAVVTLLVFVPEFLRDPATATPTGSLVWLGVLLVAAPVAAFVQNRRLAVAANAGRSLLVGAPQLPLVVALTMLDVWIDVQRGYLPPGSGEEAMAYGIGSMISAVVGLILILLVAAAARLGARRAAGHLPVATPGD